MGNAVSSDRNERHWIDLGNITGFTCFLFPDKCADGTTLSAWIRLNACDPYGGFISGASSDMDNAPQLECVAFFGRAT